MPFTTVIDVPIGTRIIALSDLHGDIDALLISLRDCSKVIKCNLGKEELTEWLSMDISKFEYECESMFYLKLRARKREPIFEWCGGTTHVVIIGDILDGKRLNTIDKITQKTVNDIYPQVEIKMLEILNFIDFLASQAGGRVIKLIGNHELLNFIIDEEEITSLLAQEFLSGKPNSTNAHHYENYTFNEKEYKENDKYETISRAEYFNIGKPGFDLFMGGGGTGVILQINEVDNTKLIDGKPKVVNINIFVHGQLVSDDRFSGFAFYDKINQWLNSNIITSPDIDSPEFLNFKSLNDGNLILWKREYGCVVNSDVRLLAFNGVADFYEAVVKNDLRTFFKGTPFEVNIEEHIKNTKIIIGHCFQNSQDLGLMNTTFSAIQNIDDCCVACCAPAVSGYTDLDEDFVFGITMECPKDETNTKHAIYKVDVSASRAFDTEEAYKVCVIDDIKKNFLKRVPQVLEIIGAETRILRTTIPNMRRCQIRPELESNIEELEKKLKLPFSQIKPEVKKEIIELERLITEYDVKRKKICLKLEQKNITQKQKQEILNLEDKMIYFRKIINIKLGINQDLVESEIESVEDDSIELFD
jgi:hypothetical protein